MRNGRLFEILYILLERGGATVKELSEKLEVSERTIRRDIDALSASGIPVYAARGRSGGVRLMDNFVLSKSLLSAGEQDEILYALQTLKATGLPAEESLLSRLSATFGRETASWIDADFSDWGAPEFQKEQFGIIKQALLESRSVSFTYYAQRQQASERTVDPVKLCFKGISWYLQAWCHKREDFRTFKLSRIEKLRLLDETFKEHETPPPIDNSHGDIPLTRFCVRFSAAAAFRVYDEFDRSAITELPDGSLLVTAEWPVGTWGVGYLLSFGSGAEVLWPPYVRRQMKLEAKKILNLYEKEDTPCPLSGDKIKPSKQERKDSK